MAALPDSPVNDGKRTIRTNLVIDEAHNCLGRKNIAARRAKLAKDAENATSAEERRRIADDMAGLEREKEPAPRPLRRFTSDATEPALFRMMDESGGEGAIHSGEGRPVYGGIMGKYAGDGRTGDSMILAGISGDTITRDRVGSADTGGEERREILSPSNGEAGLGAAFAQAPPSVA